ncbi:MAG: hypothetical protein ACR2JU_09670 [Nocardioidaceae bacterium]
MIDAHAHLNPAAIQRQIQALTAELFTLTTAKGAVRTTPEFPAGIRNCGNELSYPGILT